MYRHDPATGETATVADTYEKPNGIAISPDQKTLYVVDHNNGTDTIDPNLDFVSAGQGGVYNPATHDVPRWLNEGLAQVFEGGQLESGSLRIDAPDRVKLELQGPTIREAGALLGHHYFLDGVVDIIGMARYAPMTELTDDDWRTTFAVNLDAMFHLHAVEHAGLREERRGQRRHEHADVRHRGANPRGPASGRDQARVPDPGTDIADRA